MKALRYYTYIGGNTLIIENSRGSRLVIRLRGNHTYHRVVPTPVEKSYNNSICSSIVRIDRKLARKLISVIKQSRGVT